LFLPQSHKVKGVAHNSARILLRRDLLTEIYAIVVMFAVFTTPGTSFSKYFDINFDALSDCRSTSLAFRRRAIM
jgi:hypothetical protein